MPIDVSNYQPLEFETLTPSNVTAIGVSEAVRLVGTSKARVAIIGPVETVSIRFRTDGEDPTADIGHLVPTAGEVALEGPTMIKKFRMIATAAGPASVPVSTYM